jgi:hypothetical protein
MCLYIRKGNKIEIAKEDLVCYKVLFEDTDETWFPYFMHNDHTLKFKYNESLEAVDHLKVEDCSNIPLINTSEGKVLSTEFIKTGFHAYSVLSGLKEFCRRSLFTPATRIHKVIIPKGSEYCLGVFGDIVANRVIVTKEILDEAL